MIIFIVPLLYLLQLKVPVSMEAFINLTKGGVTYEGPKSMIQYKVQSMEMILNKILTRKLINQIMMN